MAWIYSVDTEESPWHCKSGSGPWLIVKSSDTHKEFYFPECKAENCQKPRFGTISKLLTESNFKELLILFMGASHAKTSALQELEKAWQESEADYFLKSLDCAAKYDPNLSFWKTCGTFYQMESTPWQGKWSNWAMIADGGYYPLKKSARITREKDGGCWPTPRAQEPAMTSKGYGKCLMQVIKERAAINYWPTPDASNRGARKNLNGHTINLIDAVMHQEGQTIKGMEKKNYPTPKARDYKDNGKEPSAIKRNSPSLAVKVGGKLNPNWVEWLMGVRPGWTELKPWGMEWFRYKPKKHLKN